MRFALGDSVVIIPPPQKGGSDDNVAASRRRAINAGSARCRKNHALARSDALRFMTVRQISGLLGFPDPPKSHVNAGSEAVRNGKKIQNIRKTAGRMRDSAVQLRNKPLRDLTGEALRIYFRDLNGHKPNALYDLVLGEVEPPLFEAVLDYTRGNQSRAAEILGLNRATLRKKLKHYELLG